MKQQHVSPWAILAVTSLAVFAVMLDALILFVAFPSIEHSFSAVSSAELSWVLNGYTIVYGALLVPVGRFADRVGRKRVFLAGATLFTCASMLCALAATLVRLVAARVLQAVGGAMLTPASLALTLAAFSQQRRAIAVALWGAVGALAVVAGPPLGSLVIQLASWPGIFFLNLPVGLAALLIGRVTGRPIMSRDRRPNCISMVGQYGSSATTVLGRTSIASQCDLGGWPSRISTIFAEEPNYLTNSHMLLTPPGTCWNTCGSPNGTSWSSFAIPRISRRYGRRATGQHPRRAPMRRPGQARSPPFKRI